MISPIFIALKDDEIVKTAFHNSNSINRWSGSGSNPDIEAHPRMDIIVHTIKLLARHGMLTMDLTSLVLSTKP
jgi:hypothetical protein